MNDIYKKSMYIACKVNKNKKLKNLTKNWCGTEECRAFTRIMISAIDYKNEEISINDLILNAINAINDINEGEYDEYAKGFIAGEMLGIPTEKIEEIYKEIEKEWKENMDIGYYPEAIQNVLERK